MEEKNEHHFAPKYLKAIQGVLNVWKEMSTCARWKVSAVVMSKETKRFIAMGYNGVPSGAKHCCDHYADVAKKGNMSYKEFIVRPEFRDEHKAFSQNEIHAEVNAILYASEKLAGETMFTSLSPCWECAKMIVASKIAKVVYIEQYDRKSSCGIGYLEEHGVIVRSMEDELKLVGS